MKKSLLLLGLYLIVIKGLSQPGALIPAFGTGGLVTNAGEGSFNKIGIQPSGKIIVSRPDFVGGQLIRYNANGSLDANFGPNAQTSGGIVYVYYSPYYLIIVDFKIQSDGKIIVLGKNPFSNETNIFRLNEDGSVDAGFGESGRLTHAIVLGDRFILRSITLDPSEKIVVTGTYEFFEDDPTSLLIARFNSDGTPDLTFNGGGMLIDNIDDETHEEGNQVGEICQVDGSSAITVLAKAGVDYYLRRYKPDGNLDLTFGTDGQFNILHNEGFIPTISSFDVDVNGRIAYLRGRTCFILNANGTNAAILHPPGDVFANEIMYQDDGKILLAGVESNFLGSNFWMERLNSNGGLDLAFGTNGELRTSFAGLTSKINAFAIYNRRIYAVGFVDIPEVDLYGAIAVYDGSSARLSCPNVQSSYNTDAGNCYATVNNINAAMSTTTLYANVKYKLEYIGTVEEGEGGVSGRQFKKGTTTVTYSYTDITVQSCSFNIVVEDKEAPVINCPAATNVSTDAGKCYKIIPIQGIGIPGSSDNCVNGTINGPVMPSNNIFPVGTTTLTWKVTDGSGNTATCSQTVTVTDNESPTVLTKNIIVILDNNGAVSITSAQIDNGSNDACGIKSLELSKTSFDCTETGANTVTLTVTDNNDNVSTATATVTVVDNIAPVISDISATPEVLSPPNHQMKDVFINYTSTDNCPGTVCVISNIASNEPVDGTGDGNTSPDWEYVDANHVRLRAERSANGSGRIYTITITCTDASGNTSTATQQVRVTHNIKNPHSGQPFKVGSTVNFLGEFGDKPGNTHTGKWLIDGSSAKATVTEPTVNKNGTVTGGYKFGTAGVFKLQMNVTDQKGITNYANTNGYLDAIVVIYDPNGGYTYGGGWYQSAAGYLATDKTAKGQASYGYTINYYKGATKPKGETQFKFGDLEFNAVNFDYLSISGARAQFRGTGKIIGGQSGLGFIMTVTDGQLDGSGIDKVRMKIYNKTTGAVIYDNQPGASEAANPVAAIADNSSIVISKTEVQQTATRQSKEITAASEQTVEGLEVTVRPNPSHHNFAIEIKSSNTKDKLLLQVFDALGRRVELRNNIVAGSTIQVGDLYRSGAYYLKVQQGKEHKEMKLIKLSD